MTEDKVALWVKRYALAKDAQAHRFNKFATYFEKMYAIVNDGEMAKWRSKIVIPVLAEKAWHIIAKLSTGKAGWNVVAKSPEWEESANSMEDLLAFQYDNPEFDKPMFVKLTESLIDAVVTGTAVAKVPWVKRSTKRYERLIEDGVVDLTRAVETDKTLVYNDLIPVNIFDVYIAPKSTSLQNANWIIIRSERTKADLEKAGIYKNLDKVATGKIDDPSSAFKLKRQALTATEENDSTTEIIEVLECYDRIAGKIVTIANQSVLIREQKNEYWHGKYPLVSFNIKPRSYDFWGEGIFEVTERLAAGIDDSFNHFMDNWNLSVDGMVMREEGTDLDDFIVEPGGEVTYRGQKPEFVKFPEPNPNSVQNVQGVLRNAIDGLTISPYSQGTPAAQGTDKTQGTATGIIRLQEAAQDLLGFMRYMFKTAVKEIGTQWMSNNLQYLDRPVNIIYEEGMKELSKELTPNDIQGQYELTIDSSVMEPISKDMRREAKLAFLGQVKEMYALAVQQMPKMGPMGEQLPSPEFPYFNIPNILESLANDFGIQDFDKWTEQPEMPEEMPEEEMMGEMPMDMPMEEGMPQEMPMEMPQEEFLPPEMMQEPQMEEMPPEEPQMPVEEKPGFLKRMMNSLRRK